MILSHLLGQGQTSRQVTMGYYQSSTVQSQHYVAMYEGYTVLSEFEEEYKQTRQIRAAVYGFINYLKRHE